MNKGYQAHEAAMMMATANISYLAISEWRQPNAPKLTPESIKKTKAELLNIYKYGSIVSEHQLIIYEPNIFEYNLLGAPKIYQDGRLISTTTQRKNQEPVVILSAYGVAQGGDDIRYSDGETKGSKRKGLYSNAEKEYTRIIKKHGSKAPIILMGDLQDTMTRTQADNMGETTYPQHPKGLLHWALSREMISIGWDRREDSKYLTRHSPKSNGGARGIDHVMACENANIMIHNFAVDKCICHRYVTSDHDLLCFSVDMGYQHQLNETISQAIAETTKYLFKKLSHIPVKAAHKKDENTDQIIREFIYKEPVYNSQRAQELKQRFEDALKISGQEPEITELAEKLTADITKLEQEILRDAANQDITNKDGRLIEKSETYRIEINQIMNDYDKALQQIMETLELTAKDRHLSEYKQRKAKLKGENEHNDDLPAYRQMRWARKAIKRNIGRNKRAQKLHKQLLGTNISNPKTQKEIAKLITMIAKDAQDMTENVEKAIRSTEAEHDEQKEEVEAIELEK